MSDIETMSHFRGYPITSLQTGVSYAIFLCHPVYVKKKQKQKNSVMYDYLVFPKWN